MISNKHIDRIFFTENPKTLLIFKSDSPLTNQNFKKEIIYWLSLLSIQFNTNKFNSKQKYFEIKFSPEIAIC